MNEAYRSTDDHAMMFVHTSTATKSGTSQREEVPAKLLEIQMRTKNRDHQYSTMSNPV